MGTKHATHATGTRAAQWSTAAATSLAARQCAALRLTVMNARLAHNAMLHKLNRLTRAAKAATRPNVPHALRGMHALSE
jgi:hypothetical protein